MSTLEEIYDLIDKLESKRLFQDLSGAEHGELLRLNREARILSDKDKEITEIEKQEKSREMKNRRRRGKYGEKRIAKQVGGRVDGRAGKKDVRKGMFYFEVKWVRRSPKYLDHLMDEARRHTPSDSIPVGVIHNTETQREYYVQEKEDFLDLHGA